MLLLQVGNHRNILLLILYFNFIPVTLVTVTQAPSIETAASSVTNEHTKVVEITEAPTTGW
jgi:hypothetical protein